MKRPVEGSVPFAYLMGKRLIAHLQAMIIGALLISWMIVQLSDLVTPTSTKKSFYLNVHHDVQQDFADSLTMVAYVIPQAWMGLLIAMV